MRTSKFFPVLCAAIACAPLIVARADDNPAQAAARAALMEKMNDLDAPMQNQTSSPSAGEMQTATNAVEAQPAPIIVTTNGATVEQPAPAMTNSPPIAEPMPETVPAATNAEVTPVTAMTNSMPASEPAPETTPAMTNTTEVPPVPPMTNSEPAVPVPPPVPTVAETNAVEIQPAPTMTNSMAALEPMPETIPAMTNAVATNNAAATESPSLRIQPDAVSMSQPKEKPVNVKPSEPAKASSPMQNPAFPPIQAPPLPISTSKEAQLQALDAKYKADQVSPEEYFKQREAILAEP
jgi:hypothetical protein